MKWRPGNGQLIIHSSSSVLGARVFHSVSSVISNILLKGPEDSSLLWSWSRKAMPVEAGNKCSVFLLLNLRCVRYFTLNVLPLLKWILSFCLCNQELGNNLNHRAKCHIHCNSISFSRQPLSVSSLSVRKKQCICPESWEIGKNFPAPLSLLGVMIVLVIGENQIKFPMWVGLRLIVKIICFAIW